MGTIKRGSPLSPHLTADLLFLPLQAFAQFDPEGDGTVDVENMLEALKNSSGANLQGELSHVIRQLQACSLVPGKKWEGRRGMASVDLA